MLDNLYRRVTVGYHQHSLADMIGQNPRNGSVNAVRIDLGDLYPSTFRDSPSRLLRALELRSIDRVDVNGTQHLAEPSRALNTRFIQRRVIGTIVHLFGVTNHKYGGRFGVDARFPAPIRRQDHSGSQRYTCRNHI